MTPPRYPAPEGLSPDALALWHRLVPSSLKHPGRLALLEDGLRARDRAEEFRALIKQQGLTTTTKTTGMTHVNPLVKAEKEARALWAKIATSLRLNVML